MKEGKLLFCGPDECVGCNSCTLSCPSQAIEIQRDLFANSAIISSDKCINCGLCSMVCQNRSNLRLKSPLVWKEGWSRDAAIRNSSSSGGAAKALMLKCLSDGWKVFCCVADKDDFKYQEVTSVEKIMSLKGSFYVKSNTNDSYKKVKDYLQSGFKVLFIGLPCHVAGLLLFVHQLSNANLDNLVSVDIICHGSPSLELFKMFSIEKGIDSFMDITFRQKHKKTNKPNAFDYWCVPFLEGVNYTENCYSCKYASSNRVSDITIGDSWGTKQNSIEVNNGISLLMANTPNGLSLLKDIDFVLFDVDAELSIRSQGQLQHPSKPHKKRQEFIKLISNHNSYCYAVRKIFPKELFVSSMKRIKPLFWLYRKIKRPVSDEYICFSVERTNDK